MYYDSTKNNIDDSYSYFPDNFKDFLMYIDMFSNALEFPDSIAKLEAVKILLMTLNKRPLDSGTLKTIRN